MALKIAALLGRTNTGKSRLYNALCGRPEALVSSKEHLTRDWRETVVDLDGARVRLRDTAGMPEADDALSRLIEAQTRQQISDVDVLLLVVDARCGLLPLDRDFADLARRSGKPVVLVINKMDTIAGRQTWGEFTSLGFAHSVRISAERHEGLDDLRATLAQILNDIAGDAMDASDSDEAASDGPGDAGSERAPAVLSVVVCGLGNSGKSTLINRLSGHERLLVHDQQGTTREPVGQRVRLGSREYEIYDTCGFVRRGDVLQYLADSKTERLINRTDLALYLIDSARGPVRADARRISAMIGAGQNPLIVCTKVDQIDADARERVGAAVEAQLSRLGYAVTPLWLSAHSGAGIKLLPKKLFLARKEMDTSFATSRLTRILLRAVSNRPPPTVDSRRIRLRYAHQGGSHPLLIVVHGKQTSQLNQSYQRYLSKTFCDELGLRYSMPRVVFSTDDNPYATPIRR